MNLSNPKIQEFINKQHLTGISSHTLESIIEQKPGYSIEKGQRFINFYSRIKLELLQHSVICENKYTSWFSLGGMTREQLKYFVIQFSVFSNLFLIAQLLKTINADSLESMRASKQILVNELGVIYRSNHQSTDNNPLDSCDGTVEGGSYHFGAAHFEWLLQLAKSIGLEFNDIGKRRHGAKSTLFFCDELNRLYANEDYVISQASSFAVENWAAAGFWKELIAGFTEYEKKSKQDVPLFFFTRHDEIEAQHAKHTLNELEDMYFCEEINEDVFISSGNEMLDAVNVFWNGLNEARLSGMQ
ncbi:FIG00857466: hypothetical protein [hydrothermal vent metagenome]|uniref:Uncharacterized protein n=1 Tax=hydrothermal vent metagenome TaxID=652676 RepID=A0A3B1AET4_9ZZZZ